ncbi:MAG: hypothetical protein QOE68_1269 [Thermoanaerobaculia bacterium]|jgi:hypothetical protein|nr:hypothetical protein [Thermoanaerobaculia bacterium]
MATVASTLLWIVFWTALLYAFRDELRDLLRTLLGRVRHGASVKVWNLEIGAVNALPSAIEKTEGARIWRLDDNHGRENERRTYYDRARRVMLVHKLFQSTEEGELYDILIYVIPSKDGTLSGVHSIEYFFGSYGWKNRIFVASDRSRGFPVLTAAYGPFLCTAEIVFTDGERVMLHRYIDFEMGNAVMATPRSSTA